VKKHGKEKNSPAADDGLPSSGEGLTTVTLTKTTVAAAASTALLMLLLLLCLTVATVRRCGRSPGYKRTTEPEPTTGTELAEPQGPLFWNAAGSGSVTCQLLFGLLVARKR
jgi:hypothetical protein